MSKTAKVLAFRSRPQLGRATFRAEVVGAALSLESGEIDKAMFVDFVQHRARRALLAGARDADVHAIVVVAFAMYLGGETPASPDGAA